MGAQVTLTPTPQLDAKIAQLAKGNNKKALANAYADRGTARMNDEPALPRIKYRAALADYRQALQLDPTNVQANQVRNSLRVSTAAWVARFHSRVVGSSSRQFEYSKPGDCKPRIEVLQLPAAFLSTAADCLVPLQPDLKVHPQTSTRSPARRQRDDAE
jgi:tetratricopeptide (TPR) repeat protein